MARRRRSTPATGSSPPSDAPPATPAVRPQPSSRIRAVLFRCLALASPLILLGGGNLVLYWCDVGQDTRVIVPAEESGNDTTFHFNEFASRAYYDGSELAGPETRPFQLPAAADTYRIVVIGESAVEGFPYDTDLAFSRQLETFLSRQMPERRIEVLNLGMVGINSFALVDFVPRMLACQPDLVVVYTGHNEFYGPGGVGSSATLAPFLYPVQTQLRRWRAYQWLSHAIRREPPPGQDLIATLPRDMDIALDGPAFQEAEAHLRRHLERIARSVERQNVPLLLCGLASNLSDQSPVRSLSNPQLTEPQVAERDGCIQRAQEKMEAGDHAAALAQLDQAAALDDGHALIAYRRAQCLAQAGQHERALELFRRARDLDGCRFRAPTSFRDITREVATDPHHTRSYYLDIEEALVGRSQSGVPGNDFFCEHVHFTFDGHREVARAIARAIVEQVERLPWNDAQVPTDDELARAAGLTPFDHLAALGAALKIVHGVPFNSAPDAERQSKWLAETIRGHLRSLPAVEQVAFAELTDEIRQQDVVNGVGAGLLAYGQTARALELFRTAQRRRPWEITSYIGAAKCLAALGRRDEARALIDQALELAPHDPDLRQIRADLSVTRNKTE